jgi:hypothetical protein
MYFGRYNMEMEAVLLLGTALSIPERLVSTALNGLLEAALIKHGWSTIMIRRRSSSLGFLLEGLMKLLCVDCP